MSGAASLRYRGGRGLLGAVAVIIVFGVLNSVVGTLPEAVDQVYWQFGVMVALVVFLWLLVR